MGFARGLEPPPPVDAELPAKEVLPRKEAPPPKKKPEQETEVVYKLGAGGTPDSLPNIKANEERAAPTPGTVAALPPRDPNAAAAEAASVEEAIDIDELPDEVELPTKTIAASVMLGAAGLALLLVVRKARAGERAERTRALVPGLGEGELLHPSSEGPVEDVATLAARDPDVSRVALRAFVRRIAADLTSDPTSPTTRVTVAAPIRDELVAALGAGGGQVRDVVIEATRLGVTRVGGSQAVLAHVRGYKQLGPDPEHTRIVRFRQTLTLTRPSAQRSVPPDVLAAFACPACKVGPVKLDDSGACARCAAPVPLGALGWTVTELRPMAPLPARDLPSVDQRGVAVSMPLRAQPDVLERFARLSDVIPGFEPDLWRSLAMGLFQVVLEAWHVKEWRLLRPWCTDVALDQVRAWHEPVNADRRVRMVQGVRLQRSEMLRVEVDPTFAAVTLRLWWRAREYIADQDEAVVEGDADQPVQWSACWTFVRKIGRSDEYGQLGLCPKCYQVSDLVNRAGVCTSCKTLVTDGAVRWVIGSIDNVEDYGRR